MGFAVFLAIIPIINAVFDWMSLGVTRALLSQSVSSPSWTGVAWRGALDLVIAILCLYALTGTLVLVMAGYNLIYQMGGGEGVLVDLVVRLEELRQSPFALQNWWIHGMIFSTLLPTFVHATVAMMAVLTAGLRRETREKYLAYFKKSDTGEMVLHTSDMALDQCAARFALGWMGVVSLGVLLTTVLVVLAIWLLPGWLSLLLPFAEWLASSLAG